MRRTPINRSTKPIPKKRAKLRRGKLTAAERNAVRLAVYERAKGMCELRIRPDCLSRFSTVPLPFKGSTPWDHGHMVHKRSEGAGGKTDLDNCVWGCHKCHLIGVHRGERSPTDKPVPAKTENWTQRYYGNTE